MSVLRKFDEWWNERSTHRIEENIWKSLWKRLRWSWVRNKEKNMLYLQEMWWKSNVLKAEKDTCYENVGRICTKSVWRRYWWSWARSKEDDKFNEMQWKLDELREEKYTSCENVERRCTEGCAKKTLVNVSGKRTKQRVVSERNWMTIRCVERREGHVLWERLEGNVQKSVWRRYWWSWERCEEDEDEKKMSKKQRRLRTERNENLTWWKDRTTLALRTLEEECVTKKLMKLSRK